VNMKKSTAGGLGINSFGYICIALLIGDEALVGRVTVNAIFLWGHLLRCSLFCLSLHCQISRFDAAVKHRRKGREVRGIFRFFICLCRNFLISLQKPK
jgi:hypothetical protein